MPIVSDITEHLRLNRRDCAHCAARLVRKPKEILCAWKRRKYCDGHCRAKHARTRPASVRFHEMVDTSPGQGPGGECHQWRGSRDIKGYGKFRMGKQSLAHRVAWILAHNSSPGSLFVCHRCDNPACVRPDHLFLGEHVENMADMVAKGRAAAPKGQAHYNTRLSEAQLAAIAADVRKGDIVAAEYGISKGYANRIRREARAQ